MQISRDAGVFEVDEDGFSKIAGLLGRSRGRSAVIRLLLVGLRAPSIDAATSGAARVDTD